MQRFITNILSTNIEQTSEFYVTLLGMKKHFISDWFVILVNENMRNFELGIIERTNNIIPLSLQHAPAGVMLTFVVDDCDKYYNVAKDLNANIIEAPSDMPYGQRRMLLNDPDGTVLDISSPNASVL